MFSTLSLHKQLIKAIDHLGFSEPTEVQKQTIPLAMQGKDLLVSAETGSGKTAAFLLPLLDRMLNVESSNTATRALILLPTRELALQTLKACQQLMAFTPIKAGIIVGGEPFKHQIAMLRKNPEIIIATPGRLVEHIERGSQDFTDLEMFILDEADRMLDMGFREDLLEISKVCREDRQNLLFSATLKNDIRKISDTLLNNPVSIAVNNPRAANDAIAQEVVLADDNKHKDQLVAALLTQVLKAPVLNDEGASADIADEVSSEPLSAKAVAARSSAKAKVMVFCNTRNQCDQLSHWLNYKKFKTGILHSEVSQSERKQILNRFRQGHLQILVTTDVAARGLDIPSIHLVIHYEVPRSGDDYVHRSGRSGRAGETGRAVMLVSAAEWNNMATIERFLRKGFQRIKLEGLEAKYKGPKKVKKSGNAASKKKKVTAKTKAADKKKASKSKPSKTSKGKGSSPAPTKSETGKSRSESAATVKPVVKKPGRLGASATASRDGFSPLKRKK